MGNLFSVLGLGPGMNAPLGVATLPTQRNPVRDGASGLHYSGRIYDNQRQQLSADICNSTALYSQVNDVMPGSISTTSPLDSREAVQSYVRSLGDKIPGSDGKFDKIALADAKLYESIQREYCFYEARYIAALKQFVSLVSDINGADQNAVSGVLGVTVNINKRLNSLIEIMNYVGNARARALNQRNPIIKETNNKLNEQLEVLKKQKKFLESSDVNIRTQEEMMRYSSEKSRAMNIQIMFFVALNVVALGTIMTVYKGIKPSV